MGLLNRLLGKKEKTKEPVKKEAVDSTELTEEDLDKVCGHTRMSDYSCPRVKVEPIDIRRKQSGIRTTQKTNSLGR